MIKYMPFIVPFLMVISCKSFIKENEKKLKHGFYFWKNEYSNKADSLLRSSGADFVYHRIFDLVWEQNAIHPTNNSTEYFNSCSIDYDEFIPVIYIQNQVFIHASKEQLGELAENIRHRLRLFLFAQYYALEIQKLNQQQDFNVDTYSPEYQRDYDFEKLPKLNEAQILKKALKAIHEIQIDCDWTPSTKEAYFKFLTEFKKEFPRKTISCTLRLYPYKYRTVMGIPPVDRVSLMCYNVNDIRVPSKRNNLFDFQEIKRYLNVIEEYPKPMDYALPIFNWSALYQNNQLVDLIPGITPYTQDYYRQDVKLTYDDTINGVRNYKVISPTVYNEFTGDYYKVGDIIHQEKVNFMELNELVHLIKRLNSTSDARLILFHFDEQNYVTQKKSIDALFHSF